MVFIYPCTNPENKTRADFYSLLEMFLMHLLYQAAQCWELEIHPLCSINNFLALQLGQL